MSSEMRGREPFHVAASIKFVLSDLSSVLDSPGERYLREERKIDLGPIEDLLASKHAIGWHPEVLFNEPGHPPCIKGGLPATRRAPRLPTR
jgi:hypothetical protein